MFKYENQLRDIFGFKYVIRRMSDGIGVIPLYVGNTYSGFVSPWNTSASRFGIYLTFKSTRAKNAFIRLHCPTECSITQNASSELVLTFNYNDWDIVDKKLRFKRSKASSLQNLKNPLPTPTLSPKIAKITIGG